MLTEYLPLPGDSPVIFWHPKVPKKLTVQTGVSGISWQYALNLNTVPTFGGEVTQVLSSYIGPITVHGQTRDAKQLRDIYSWFVYYMQIAGLRARNEEYVIMDYPTRGWSFWIMPTQLPDFLINRDHIAVEWNMTAEVVADDASSYDVLEGHTMSGFYEAAFDPHMFDIGFNGYDDPRNVTLFGKDGSTGQRIGDNMQSLIGAWASGDFMHFAVDTGHKAAESQGLKSAQDYWQQILGGSDVLSGGSGSGTQALAGAYTGGEPVGRVQVAGAIASAFEAVGIPGYLAVASAIQESNLNPDARQNGGDSAMGLFQSFPTGAAGGQAHRAEVIKAFANPNDPVTKYWAATHQISDAVGWWAPRKPITNPPQDWTKRAQGAGDPQYGQHVASHFDEAKSLIAQYQKANNVSGDAQTLAKAILNHKNWVPYTSAPDSDLKATIAGSKVQGAAGPIALKVSMLQGLLVMLNNGFKLGLSVICTGHHNDGGTTAGHSGGFAFDIAIIDGTSISAGGAQCRTNTLNLLSFADSMKPTVDQLINGGVGNGANDSECLNRNMYGGQVISAAQAVQIYTQGTIDQHKNHVHAGWQ